MEEKKDNCKGEVICKKKLIMQIHIHTHMNAQCIVCVLSIPLFLSPFSLPVMDPLKIDPRVSV